MYQQPNESPIGFIFRTNKEFKALSKLTSQILIMLNDELNQPDTGILGGQVIGNTFQFSFLGLNFITKTEVSFDTERLGFIKGELNTYCIINKKETLEKHEAFILGYTYNRDGLFQDNTLVIPNFTPFYYRSFVEKVIEFTLENKIKFQLSY